MDVRIAFIAPGHQFVSKLLPEPHTHQTHELPVRILIPPEPEVVGWLIGGIETGFDLYRLDRVGTDKLACHVPPKFCQFAVRQLCHERNVVTPDPSVNARLTAGVCPTVPAC